MQAAAERFLGGYVRDKIEERQPVPVPFVDPLPPALADLSAAVTELHNATDRVNAILDDLDEELEKIGPGVNVWLEPRDGWRIGYARVSGKWHLAAERMALASPEAVEPISLSTAPRAVRVAAVEQRVELTAAITARVREILASVQKASP